MSLTPRAPNSTKTRKVRTIVQLGTGTRPTTLTTVSKRPLTANPRPPGNPTGGR